uniref:Uncharacterized protein n=1 Tax=Rhizophora mucronata TaxID=61149 RepID=A0A2P2NZQ0_RHIMU
MSFGHQRHQIPGEVCLGMICVFYHITKVQVMLSIICSLACIGAADLAEFLTKLVGTKILLEII